MTFNKVIPLFLLVSVYTFSHAAYAQINTFQFEKIDSLQRIEKRKMAIFIHTDWCKYCKAMQNTTLKNNEIINTLNTHFYFMDLNAEEVRDITFGGRTFAYQPTGANTGIHELAEQLATVDNTVSYPTLCFLNAENEIIFQCNQYINAHDLYTLLTQLIE